MKIMHFVDELHFGGLENHIALFTNELLKRSHRVFLHAMNISPYYLTKIKSQSQSFRYFLGEEGLLQAAAAFDPDIIHIHPFNSIHRGCRMARELQRPLILTMHGLYDNGIDKSPDGYETSRNINRIIAVDQGVVEFLAQHAAEPEKVLVIRNGLDLSCFYPLARNTSAREALSLKKDWFTITLVSRFDGGKEVPVFNLLNIAPAIADKLGGLNIILVGDGPHMNAINRECKLLCARNPRIKISAVGMQMDVRPFLAMADLVASCDMAATEAMACGRPVLAAFPSGFYGIVNKKNFDEIVYRRGLTCNNLPDKRIVKQIITLASDKQYWDQVSNESCTIIRDNYNIVDSVTRLEKLYYQNV